MAVMNVNLGAPYEDIMDNIIAKEYAGNRTEVIRQALIVYQQKIEEEEVMLVNRAIEAELAEVETGEQKTYSLDEIKRELGLD